MAGWLLLTPIVMPLLGVRTEKVSDPTAMLPCRAVDGLNVSDLNVTGAEVKAAETETGALIAILQILPWNEVQPLQLLTVKPTAGIAVSDNIVPFG